MIKNAGYLWVVFDRKLALVRFMDTIHMNRIKKDIIGGFLGHQ